MKKDAKSSEVEDLVARWHLARAQEQLAVINARIDALLGQKVCLFSRPEGGPPHQLAGLVAELVWHVQQVEKCQVSSFKR